MKARIDCSATPMQIFSDGEKLVVIIDGQGAWFFDGFCVRTANVNFHLEWLNSGYGDYMRGFEECELTLSLISSGEVKQMKDFKPLDIGIIHGATVLELFKIIGKKIEARK